MRLDEARHEGPGVAGALDEGMDRIAVGGDGGAYDAARVVGDLDRGAHRFCAAGNSALVRGACIVDDDRDIFDAVAVQGDVARDLVFGHQACGDDEAQIVLLEHVAGSGP